jgi:hypothetical protein
LLLQGLKPANRFTKLLALIGPTERHFKDSVCRTGNQYRKRQRHQFTKLRLLKLPQQRSLCDVSRPA